MEDYNLYRIVQKSRTIDREMAPKLRAALIVHGIIRPDSIEETIADSTFGPSISRDHLEVHNATLCHRSLTFAGINSGITGTGVPWCRILLWSTSSSGNQRGIDSCNF